MKSFGGNLALDDVEVTLRKGTVHALLGGNGSGKSTLIKILAGVYQADAGELEVFGESEDLSAWNGRRAHAAGLRFVHQDLGLFDSLTVEENFAAASGYPVNGLGAIRWPELHRRVEDILEQYELDIDPSTVVARLRPAERTMIAIARAMQDGDASKSILVLDEPTASLGREESERLIASILRRAELGQTIVMTSHRLGEARRVAQDFTVLRDGKLIASLVDAAPDEDELVTLMAGRSVGALSHTGEPRVHGEERLAVENVRGGPLTDVSLNVGRGEILGIAGLGGSGRSTLLRMIFGDLPLEAGTFTLDGKPFRPAHVDDAMDRGIALVPENRGRDAAFGVLSVRENLSAASLERFRGLFGLSRRLETGNALESIRRFAIKVAGPEAAIASASGGNQQKVILSRWLQREPLLLLLDEPTQGVDIMSRVDIYEAIRAASSKGLSVIVASSDMAELCALCDRVAILRDGVVVQDVAVDNMTPEELSGLLLHRS
jgi:ribose transport system ATP-binding protein